MTHDDRSPFFAHAAASHGLPTKVQGDLTSTGKVSGKVVKVDPIDKSSPAVTSDVLVAKEVSAKMASATYVQAFI